jgi:hypothetical protein
MSCPWGFLEPADLKFCEERLCGWVVEPANTWSNLGFIVAGWMILKASRGKRRAGSLMTGLTSVWVGVGSTLFHATGTRWGEVIDVSAMYLISALFVTLNLQRIRSWSGLRAAVFFMLLAVGSIVMLVWSGANGILMFTAQLVFFGLSEVWMAFYPDRFPAERKHFYALSLTFGVSCIVWLLDLHRIVCIPSNHVLGGHGVWHLLNGLALWFYFRYQESFPLQRT